VIHPKVLAQPFHIVQQMVSGVDAHIGGRVGGGGTALPTPALVELNDAVALRVEEAPPLRTRARSWAAVHDQRGLAAGIAGGLPIDEISIPNLEQPMLVRLNFWIAHGRQSL
jgi:hypothetical protein